MTAPVATDDLVQGAQKYLSGKADVLAVLGTFPGTTTPYLFQHELWQNMENTSSTAAVLTRGSGGWAAPNLHNTMRFPRLGLEITCDPLRDEHGMITDVGEVQRRIQAAHLVLDAYLHRPAGGTRFFGSLRIIDSTRLAEPVVYPVEDGSGMIRMLVYYGITEG